MLNMFNHKFIMIIVYTAVYLICDLITLKQENHFTVWGLREHVDWNGSDKTKGLAVIFLADWPAKTTSD